MNIINIKNENENENVNKEIIDYIYASAKEIYETLGYGYKEHIYVTAMNIHLHSNNYFIQ